MARLAKHRDTSSRLLTDEGRHLQIAHGTLDLTAGISRLSKPILLNPIANKHGLDDTQQSTPTASNFKVSRCMDQPCPKIRAQPLSVWLAGPYAILLQLAHPGIASASCAHSRFVTEGISRLRRTAAFIISLTHGTEREQKVIAGQITRQHSSIRSVGKGVGGGGVCPYDARDPELQKWVAATLFKGMVLTDEVFTSAPESWLVRVCQRLGIQVPRARMSTQEKESLLHEASCLATSLDMPVEMWFSSVEEFETYFEGILNGGLSRESPETRDSGSSLSPASKKMGHALLYEMRLPFWLGFWLRPLMRLLVGAWLPDGLRREFGLEGLSPDRIDDAYALNDDPPRKIDYETGRTTREPKLELDVFPWRKIMSWTYISLVWAVWLVDWLMPAWLEACIVGLLVSDMRFAADGIERTGRWPM